MNSQCEVENKVQDEDWENGSGWEGYEGDGEIVEGETQLSSMEKEWKEGRGKWVWIEKRRWMWISYG